MVMGDLYRVSNKRHMVPPTTLQLTRGHGFKMTIMILIVVSEAVFTVCVIQKHCVQMAAA